MIVKENLLLPPIEMKEFFHITELLVLLIM